MSLLGNIAYNGLKANSGGGGGLPGVTDPFVNFTVGDGQSGSPVNGQVALTLTSFNGQNLVNKRILWIREGIALNYNTSVAANGEIRRYNSGGLGGFTFEGGLSFQTGERYSGYIIGVDNTIQT